MEKKLKILYVSHAVEEEGGAEISLKTFAQEFARRGHTIRYAALSPYKEFKTYVFKRFRPFYTYELYEMYLARFLIDVIRKEKPDVIHANDRFSIIPAIRAAKHEGVPIVTNFRDFCLVITTGGIPYNERTGFFDSYGIKEIWKTSPLRRFPWELYRYWYIKRRYALINQADVRLFHSSSVEEWALKQGIRNTTRIANAIRPGFPQKVNREEIRRQWNIPPKAQAVSFLSAFNIGKGVDTVIKLLQRRSTLKNDPYFFILGTGKEKEKVSSLAQKDPKIIYPGKIPHADIYKAYVVSDIVLMPSKIEPFSRIVIESMSMGVPVISSNRGGGKDVIENGKSGLLVDADDIGQWVAAINRLTTDKKLVSSFKKRFPAIVKRYAPENAYKGLAEVYLEAIRANQKKRLTR